MACLLGATWGAPGIVGWLEVLPSNQFFCPPPLPLPCSESSHSVVSHSLRPHSLHAPLSLGFSRQESWDGLLRPPPRDLPDPGIEPRSPALQEDSLPSEPSPVLKGHMLGVGQNWPRPRLSSGHLITPLPSVSDSAPQTCLPLPRLPSSLLFCVFHVLFLRLLAGASFVASDARSTPGLCLGVMLG